MEIFIKADVTKYAGEVFVMGKQVIRIEKYECDFCGEQLREKIELLI